MTRTEDDLRHALGTLTDPPERLTALVGRLDEPATAETRHRRRALVAAAGLATAAVAVTVTLAAGSGDHHVESGHSPSPTTSVGPPPPADLVGTPVRTGVTYEGARMYVWVGRDAAGALMISAGNLRHGRPVAGFMNQRASSGDGTGAYRCGDRTPGFRCTYDGGGLGTDHHAWLLIGYVVGDVHSVVITVDGKPRHAGVATWSADPRVHVWWLAGPVLDTYPRKNSGIGTVTTMLALDAAGHVVARAAGAVAHG